MWSPEKQPWFLSIYLMLLNPVRNVDYLLCSTAYSAGLIFCGPEQCFVAGLGFGLELKHRWRNMIWKLFLEDISMFSFNLFLFHVVKKINICLSIIFAKTFSQCTSDIWGSVIGPLLSNKLGTKLRLSYGLFRK